MDPEQTALDLWSRYQQRQDLGTLEEAVAAFRAAADASGGPVPLANLSNALLVRYQRTGQRTALDEAIEAGRQAVARAQHPGEQVAALSNLSGALKAAFHLTADIALLDDAVTALRRAAEQATDDQAYWIVQSNLGHTLNLRYEQTQEMGTLQEGITALRESLTHRSGAGPVPAAELASLWTMLCICYERTADASTGDEAVAIARQLVEAAPLGPDRAGWLSNLGLVLRLGYENGGDASLLTEAIDVLRQAIAGTQSSHPHRAQIVANMDRALELSYQRTAEPGLLEEQVRIHRAYLDAFPAQGAERSHELAAIAEVIRRRFESTGELSALDELVGTMREAWAAVPEDDPDRGAIGLNLGVALRIRDQAGADPDLIAEAVRVLRAASGAIPADDTDAGAVRTNLLKALQSLYERSGDPAVLGEAIAAGSALAADHPSPDADILVADSLAARYEAAGDEADLRRSMALFGGPQGADGALWDTGTGRRIDAWSQAYGSRRDPDALDRGIATGGRLLTHPWFGTLPARSQGRAYGETGVLYLRRYQERSDGADLDEALRCAAAAVELTERTDDAAYAGYAGNLAVALTARYERGKDTGSLRKAADLLRALADAAPDSSPERADALTNLGSVWRHMREATGDDTYLDAEVTAWEEAAQVRQPDPARYGGTLNNASLGLHNRYDARGDEEDLSRSIAYSRQALEVAPEDHPDRPGWQSNLGNTLRHRYERTGVIADLDDAIDVLERAVQAAPAQWYGRRQCLTSLGSALRNRARTARSAEMLRRAVEASEQALELTSPASAEYDLYAGNLATGLGEVAAATGEPEFSDAEISLYEELMDRMPQASPRRPRLLANLAAALLNRPAPGPGPGDLARARELIRESLARTVPGTAEFVGRTTLLARVLVAEAPEAAGSTGAPGAGERAREADQAFREACATALRIQPAEALGAALRWARWCEDRGAWLTAVEAYAVAAQAADHLFTTQVGRQDKEAWLRAANGMPAQAALALARAGQDEAAALILERGRVRLLAEALGRTSAALDGLSQLGQQALAERLRAAQRRLGALEAGEAGVTRGEALTDRMRGDDLASALTEHSDALARIRQVPGYERFLRQADLEDLARAARRPIVYLAAARLGGAAFIVTRADQGQPGVPRVALVDLPKLTEAAVRRQADALQNARQQHGRDPGHWRGTLDAVGRWLWIAALGPLLDALETSAPACPGPAASPGSAARAASAVSLVPTGLLAALPLHAAWTVDHSAPTGRQYAVDRQAIAYVPNAMALLAAGDLVARRPLDSLLGVADPQAGQAGSLPLADAEVAAAAALLGGPATELHGAAATREHVLTGLPGHSVVHFACHGRARPDQPMQSALLMTGGQALALSDVFGLRLARPGRSGLRLVVLSACETQLPGDDLPDELVGLPSGFLQAGAAAVVASQWKIADMAAALVTMFFYRQLTSGADGPAALRAAQLWLRDTTNGDKAAFLHPRSGHSDLPEAVARPLWRRLVTMPPTQRSFAEPSQWAAMTYTGA